MSNQNIHLGGHNFSGITLTDEVRAQLGDVHHYHAPPKEKSRPRSLVSQYFSRDKNFVGREDILHQIDTRLSAHGHNRVALTGLGGIGKSQIAIEYGYRYEEKHPDQWLFWVHAGSRDRFVQSYRRLAAALNVEEATKSESVLLDTINRYLSDRANGHWLMIIDNADDSDLVLGTPGEQEGQFQMPLSSFVSGADHGSILITSRNDTGVTLAEGVGIRVESFDETDATELLRRTMRKTIIHAHNARKLARQLDCIPLAITQAANYIIKARMTMARYSRLFQKEDILLSLLGREWYDLRRDPAVSNAVLVTMKITFKQLRRSSPRALDMLSRMSLLDRQWIHHSLVVIDDTEPEKQEEAVGTLLDHALVILSTNDCTYTMHRLTQVCMQAWLQDGGCLDTWKHHIVLLMSAKLNRSAHRGCIKDVTEGSETPFVVEQEVAALLQLLPHARLALNYIDDTTITHAQIHLQYVVGKAEHSQGTASKAVAILEKAALDVSSKMGVLHPDTLRVEQTLVDMYGCVGLHSTGAALAERVATNCAIVCGADHPRTLDAQRHLAVIYHFLGKHSLSEAICKNALAGLNRQLGPSHTFTEAAEICLIEILNSTWRLAEAGAISKTLLHRMRHRSSEWTQHQATAEEQYARILMGCGQWQPAGKILSDACIWNIEHHGWWSNRTKETTRLLCEATEHLGEPKNSV